MSLSKVYPQLPPSPALTSSPNLIPKKDAQSSSSSMAASQLTDIKLSKYYANNKHNHPTPQKCNFKLEPFYLYTILIFAATIILIISPKLGIVFIKGIIKFTANISTIPEPGRSFMFAGLLYMHQFLAIPLQSVTVMLVTFCTRSFFYGFILTTLINISSSLLVYFLGRKCCYRWLHSKYKENIFVLVIRDEASRNPIKVAFMFRFMNIPGLYKNIGLILSDAINFKWYILPAIMESCISTAFLCILGNVMTHGLDVLDPKAIGNKKKELKAVFILSYFFMGVQILCIFIGIIISVFKYKKMQRVKREVERRRCRESVKTKGYIHDVENHYYTGQGAEADNQFKVHSNIFDSELGTGSQANLEFKENTADHFNIQIFDHHKLNKVDLERIPLNKSEANNPEKSTFSDSTLTRFTRSEREMRKSHFGEVESLANVSFNQ
mgnify:CR=1 FL=1